MPASASAPVPASPVATSAVLALLPLLLPLLTCPASLGAGCAGEQGDGCAEDEECAAGLFCAREVVGLSSVGPVLARQ
ncbi:MAG: hypothetical protein FJ125_03615, partial [Deltaproteobacteria bacterium]|nr:hypothetical protein [Deltaproteobacteria bacterium]